MLSTRRKKRYNSRNNLVKMLLGRLLVKWCSSSSKLSLTSHRSTTNPRQTLSTDHCSHLFTAHVRSACLLTKDSSAITPLFRTTTTLKACTSITSQTITTLGTRTARLCVSRNKIASCARYKRNNRVSAAGKMVCSASCPCPCSRVVIEGAAVSVGPSSMVQMSNRLTGSSASEE